MKTNKHTSASDLAEMGYCEKKMLFKARIGDRRSPDRARACRHGLDAHRAFHRDAVKIAPTVYSSEPKPWCFIASELFGTAAPETYALRAFRDEVLRRTVFGRAFIRCYYRLSPAAACWLHQRPRARWLVGSALRLLVWGLLRRTGTPLSDEGVQP